MSLVNYDFQSSIDCIVHIALINLILSYLEDQGITHIQHNGGRNGPARMRRRERRANARKNAEVVEASNEKVEAATEIT